MRKTSGVRREMEGVMKRKQARIIAAAAAVLIGLSGGGSALAECPDEVILEEAELLSAGQETTGELPASGQGETEEPELLSETGTEAESAFAADDEANQGDLLTEPGETGEFPEGESETSPEGIGETELLLAEEDKSSDMAGNSRESETAEVSGTFEMSDDLVVENITVVEDSAAQQTRSLLSGTGSSRFDEDDFEYRVLPDGTIEITEFIGDVAVISSGVEIPGTLDGKQVTRIGEKAFQYNISLPRVVIPEGVTSIGDYAFYYCLNLKEVSLPESLQTIGAYVFEYCCFEDIVIPDKVTSIGSEAFNFCDDLKTVTLSPSSELREIGDGAFRATALTEIHLPDGVTRIGKETFYGTELTEVILPDSVTEIGERAFASCEELKSVTFPRQLVTLGDSCFRWCEKLEQVVLPDGLTSIGDSAFSSCESLTAVSIPETVTRIGTSAFWSCESLTAVTIPEGITTIENNTFSSCENLKSVDFPANLISIGDDAFRYCHNLGQIVLPKNLKTIGQYAFYECTALEVLTIPASVESIGKGAFDDCTLKQMYFEGKAPAMDEAPFGSWFQSGRLGDTGFVSHVYMMHQYWSSFSSARLNYGSYVDGVFVPSVIYEIWDSDTPHTWDSGTVSAPASCTEPGTIVYTCTVCQTTRTESLAASGTHTYGGYVTEQEATALAQGVRSRTCLVCGQKESEPTAKLEPTVSVAAKNVALQVGQSTAKLKVTDLAPGDYVVSWKSSNPKVVKVNGNGKITAKKKTGKATITVTLASGLEQKITVKVQKGEVKTSKISGVSKKLTLNKGKKKKLSPVVTPITSEQKITFSSSNSKVAAVNKKGVVSAKKKGKATITVRSGKKTVKCKVTVK